jgi:hypothetical protein
MKNLLLEKALKELNCDRILIARLHPNMNTEFNYEGTPVCPICHKIHLVDPDLSFSVIFEEKKEHVFSVVDYIKNIPVSILEKEFKGDTEKIVMSCAQLVENLKCVRHLQKLDMEIIFNQLLSSNNHIWGVLSFQYTQVPNWINNEEESILFMRKIKEYKLLLNNC